MTPTTKTKDPKKVAAGRAGAAARSAKQKRLLDQFQADKEQLEHLRAENEQLRVGTSSREEKVRHATQPSEEAPSITPWVVGAAAALVGLAYLARASVVTPRVSAREQVGPPTKSPPAAARPVQQLEVKKDPFHME